MNNAKVRCGDCRYFARDGKCNFFASAARQDRSRPFQCAPFWVWSDFFSDREQVRSNVETLCATFEAKEQA